MKTNHINGPNNNGLNYRHAELLKPPGKGLKICVTIPAKNEEALIYSTLTALLEQKAVDKECYEVLILINHSSDRTFMICKEFQNNHPDFSFHILVTYSDTINHVGAARKKIMDVAYTRLPDDDCLIAMTDADTQVPNNWIARLLYYATQDIHLICGTIEIDIQELSPYAQELYAAKEQYLDYRCRLEALWLPEVWDKWPKHAANSGPNMTIKRSAYTAVGGMPALSCLEDSALMYLVLKKGLKIKHALDIPVITSSRLTSRAVGGFGNELNNWSNLKNREYLYAVEGKAKLIKRFKAFRLIKEAYENNGQSDFNYISKQLKLPMGTLQKLFEQQGNYQSMNIALITILERNRLWQEAYPNISVFEANVELKHFFKENDTAQPLFSQSTSS